MPKFTIRRVIAVTSVAMILCTLMSLASIVYLARVADHTIAVQVNRDDLKDLLEEVMRSSEDQTRIARTFVMTRDGKFEFQHRYLIAVRNGEVPRPRSYGRYFWTLAAGGLSTLPQAQGPARASPETAMRYRFQQQMLTKQENELLEKVFRALEEQVDIEREAMNAAKGLRQDDRGGYTIPVTPDHSRAQHIIYSPDYHKTKARLTAPLKKLEYQVNGRTAAELTKSQQRQEFLTHLSEVLSVLSMLTAIGSVVLLNWRVLKPLLRIRNTMARMGAGDLSRPVPMCERRCEIGEIAREAEQFRLQSAETARLAEEVKRASEEAARNAKERQAASEEATRQAEAQRAAAQEAMELSAREQARMAEEVAIAEKARRFQDEVARVVDAAKHGDLSVRARIDRDYPVGVEIGEGLNDMLTALEATLAQVGGALERIARGDLSCVIDTDATGQLGAILTAAEEARHALSDLVTQTRENAEHVVALSGSIAGAARNLSQRTEANAATLEESAAALMQLTESVRSAAEAAERADRIGHGTRGEVEHSNEVVTEAIEAMDQIEGSSKKISKIISVIEGIAFQTNLLALNAGVEAARAGEAGRGFAVVASEVRALAQRSSEAASEITVLISQSSQQVTRGAQLVGRTGDALRRILESVGEISSQVSAIAHSAREQSTGISEINTAVHQLDSATQANAAMVSDTSESSAALSRQATDLLSSVSRFVLPGDDGDHTNALRLAG